MGHALLGEGEVAEIVWEDGPTRERVEDGSLVALLDLLGRVAGGPHQVREGAHQVRHGAELLGGGRHEVGLARDLGVAHERAHALDHVVIVILEGAEELGGFAGLQLVPGGGELKPGLTQDLELIDGLPGQAAVGLVQARAGGRAIGHLADDAEVLGLFGAEQRLEGARQGQGGDRGVESLAGDGARQVGHRAGADGAEVAVVYLRLAVGPDGAADDEGLVVVPLVDRHERAAVLLDEIAYAAASLGGARGGGRDLGIRPDVGGGFERRDEAQRQIREVVP